jgi:hypothetical protein
MYSVNIPVIEVLSAIHEYQGQSSPRQLVAGFPPRRPGGI